MMRRATFSRLAAALACAAVICARTAPAQSSGEAEDALLAASCSGCHARDVSEDTMPSIYGRPAEVIKDAMLAFRSDARPATVMNRIAKGYSEAEIERIAAYLATRIDDVAD